MFPVNEKMMVGAAQEPCFLVESPAGPIKTNRALWLLSP